MSVLPQEPQPAPAPAPMRLTCRACDATPLVHWRRRLTDEEFAAYVAVEQARRDLETLLADPQKPAPVFGPLPTADDTTRVVHACGQHAIGIDAAALIHAKTCTAPNPATLPGCDCTPEPPLPPEPAPTASPLPASWGGTGDA
ncbi:hypothetical protein [Streptomyces violascens]|uniref:hypothetical protein n=1 Tax=Streptomyces violascens TaxID=67381 RepID=UPI003689D955